MGIWCENGDREQERRLPVSEYLLRTRLCGFSKRRSSELKAQENLTVTPDFRINLFNQRVSLESQVTLSVLTRDLEGTQSSSSDLGVPEFLITIYQPRSSTRLNYAGTALARFQSGMFDLDIGYERDR